MNESMSQVHPKSINRMRFALVVSILVLSAGAAIPAANAAVDLWDLHEIVLTSSKSYGNPFTGVSVFADFTSPTGNPTRVYGFYDGDGSGGQGNLWKIRFMADEIGTWQWVSVASDSSNGGLHNRSGSFAVTESEIPGPVAPSDESPTSWRHANGRRVLWTLGYAKYLAAADRSHPCVGGWQDYLDWLEQHRFNGVFFVLQPTGINTCSTCWDGVAPWSALNGDPAPRWGRERNSSVDYFVTPWAESGNPNEFGDSSSNVDFGRFYLPLWQNIDAIVREMQRKGMIAHVVMYNDESFYPVESSADERRYWDYVLRRLGGYWNVVFNDGVDLFEYRSSGWVEEWQQYFENKDPFGHARSSRHGDDDSSLATFRSVQAANQTAPTSIGSWRDILARTPAKPVTEDDGIRAEKGSGIPPERFRQLAWWSVLAGPGAFGANWAGSYEPGNWFSNLDSGAEGLLFVEQRTRFLIDFDLDNQLMVPFWRLDVHDELVSGTNVYCVAEPGKHYLIYLDEGAPSQTTVDLSDTSTVLTATWLDPDTGERRDAGSFTPGSSKTFTTPFGRPAVLYIGEGEDGGPGGVFDLVFADGFEPGSTSSWALVVN